VISVGAIAPAGAATCDVSVGNEVIAVDELSSTGPVVIFESGLGEPTDSWGEVAKSLSSCMRVVMCDRPGLGASGPRADAGPALANDVAQRLPPPYIVVG
jgi:pimeloyl-ACP methyl ester carboxylesterase